MLIAHSGEAGIAGASGGEGGVGGESGVSSASGGEGGAPVGLVEPDDFDGLVLWLKASSCSFDSNLRVSSCPDESGLDNDAVAPAEERRPKLLATALNGHDCLEFDGGDPAPTNVVASRLSVADAASIRFGTDEVSVVLAARWRNPHHVTSTYGGYGGLLHKAEPISPFRGLAVFANYPASYAQQSVRRLAVQLELSTSLAFSYSVNLNDDEFRVYSARRAGERLEVRINGRSEGAAQVSPETDLSALGEPILIGGQDNAPLRGDIAEIVLIRGATTESMLAGLERGLMLKYGL